MHPLTAQLKGLSAKNKLMVELIQEVLASEDGEDIDWESWDARAKDVLRANKIAAQEIQNKRKEERKRKRAAAWVEKQKEEIERALVARANAPETSVYVRSLIKSAERRKQALSARMDDGAAEGFGGVNSG